MKPEFWSLIDDTRPAYPDPSAHAAAITAALTEFGLDRTLEHAASFDRAMDALYTWPLWGTAYLAFGGCSDDAFEYLRAWIVAAGEAAWRKAAEEPEGLFVELLGGSPDPDARWQEIGLNEGEPLLYAAGDAHHQLTGEWLSGRSHQYPDEPSGEEWDEDELPDIFPDLAAALPDGWWGGADSLAGGGDRLGVMIQVERGLDALSVGDLAGAARLLEEIVDDPAQWAQVAEDRRVDVAYVVGIGRLQDGDVEGAATVLHLVESRLSDADHVRRALAQVELARGDLESASRWIHGEGDHRLDRVLAAKLAWRRGHHDEAVRRAAAEMSTLVGPNEHPWDVAGAAYQLGQIFADAGELDDAVLTVGVMTRLLEGAPGDLPLLTHLQLLAAAITRLQGRSDDALTSLRQLRTGLSGTDLAECLREEARCEQALGHTEEAIALYRASVETFESAGERWDARTTRDEAERLAG